MYHILRGVLSIIQCPRLSVGLCSFSLLKDVSLLSWKVRLLTRFQPNGATRYAPKRALLHFDENARTPSHTNYRPRPRAANGASADWTAANAAMRSPPSRLRGPFVLGPLSARTRRCSGGPTRTDHPPCLKGIMTSRHFT